MLISYVKLVLDYSEVFTQTSVRELFKKNLTAKARLSILYHIHYVSVSHYCVHHSLSDLSYIEIIYLEKHFKISTVPQPLNCV